MYIINLTKNDNGSYSALQYVTHNTVLPGTAEFPAIYYNAFYPPDKRSAGFVDLTMSDGKITNVTWNEEAYQAWCEENPEVEPVEIFTDTEVLNTLLGVTE